MLFGLDGVEIGLIIVFCLPIWRYSCPAFRWRLPLAGPGSSRFGIIAALDSALAC